MGIVVSPLALVTSGVSNGSLATGSFSPFANSLILACIANTSNGGIAVSTLVGNGLTWVKVAAANGGGLGWANIEIWRAMGASPASGPLTVTWASNVLGSLIRVVQMVGVDTSGTNGSGAIVQSAASAISAQGVNPSVTLAAFNPNSRNTSFYASNVTIITGNIVETGWVTDSSTAIPNGGHTGISIIAYKTLSTDNTMVITQPTSNGYGIVGIEVKSAT